jgi:hypothetical protein
MHGPVIRESNKNDMFWGFIHLSAVSLLWLSYICTVVRQFTKYAMCVVRCRLISEWNRQNNVTALSVWSAVVLASCQESVCTRYHRTPIYPVGACEQIQFKAPLFFYFVSRHTVAATDQLCIVLPCERCCPSGSWVLLLQFFSHPSVYAAQSHGSWTTCEHSNYLSSWSRKFPDHTFNGQTLFCVRFCKRLSEEVHYNWTNARSDNKVHELASVCLPWQQWTETSVWFDDVVIPSLLFGNTEKAAWES